MQKCPSPLSPPFSDAPSFLRMSQVAGRDKQNGRHSVDYHPCPSRLALRIILPYFYKVLRGFIFSSVSRMIIEFSFKLVYATMVERNFQIYGVNIPRKCIESAFLLPPPPLTPFSPSILKTLTQLLIITPLQVEGNYSFPQEAFFRKPVLPKSRKGWRKL